MAGKPKQKLSPLFNRSLEKGIVILQSFGARRRTMTLAELAEAAQISRGSAQRSVHTLQAMGLIEKHPRTRRFQLTPKVMTVGCNYLEADALIDAANPFLAKLSSTCNENTNLTEPDGLEMVYVARFPSHKHIPIHVPIGRHLPMFCTSAGRAYLSGLPDPEVLGLLKASERRAYTPLTCTDVPAPWNWCAGRGPGDSPSTTRSTTWGTSTWPRRYSIPTAGPSPRFTCRRQAPAGNWRTC